jgi:probable HAF family extracellular repeat protein
MRSLGDDLGTNTSWAFDVNESGQVTGYMQFTTSDTRAFIWQDGKVIDLGPIPGGYTSRGSAINDAGDVVGFGKIPDEEYEFRFRAFAYVGGVMTNLGTLPGFAESTARDINDDRDVVGQCTVNPDHGPIAFLWRDGVMHDLNDLVVEDFGLYLSGGRAISDAGQILVSAYEDGESRAVILTPAPLIGDLNCDGLVGFIDLLMLLSSWNACTSCDADLDGDGTVDATDLLLMLSNWE